MFEGLETDLRERVRVEEEAHTKGDRGSDSLWDHLERVARLAVSLGRAEGVDEDACRLAGLFHDAGKFARGGYHKEDRPEEESSVDALLEVAGKHAVGKALVDEVAGSIRQLYRDDPEFSPLTKVLFDADNLDKLGPLGVANYFVKLGLRGGAVSEKTLYRLTVELTYARHAPRCLMTETGRRLAAERAPETERFLTDLLEQLRGSGLFDFRVSEIVHDGLPLVVVAPPACGCGKRLDRSVREVAGMKCSEIHLEHTCGSCGFENKIRFCRPRLLA